MLMAGCGGSHGSHVAQLGPGTIQSRPSAAPGGSSTTGASTSSRLLAFSGCMRSHGVPSFPDPQPGAENAKFPGPQQLRVDAAQLSAAENACQHLLPPGVDDQFPVAEVPMLLRGMVAFSGCMRAHGVPNWPDPSVNTEGRPVFVLSTHGFTREQAHSPLVTDAVGRCQHLLPSDLGGVPVG
jgi:hypothetical protein